MKSKHECVELTVSDPVPGKVLVMTTIPRYTATYVCIELFRELLDASLLVMAILLRGSESLLVKVELDLFTSSKLSTGYLLINGVVDHVKEGLTIVDVVEVDIENRRLFNWVQTLPVVTPCCPKYFRCVEYGSKHGVPRKKTICAQPSPG